MGRNGLYADDPGRRGCYVSTRNMQPRFLTPLKVSLVKTTTDGGSGTWRVLSPLVYYSRVTGSDITVPAGFETDFGSTPRWLPLAYALVGNIAQSPSTVHDYLYTYHPVTRRVADAVLYEAMRSTGVARWRCMAWWVAVRLFGWSHW